LRKKVTNRFSLLYGTVGSRYDEKITLLLRFTFNEEAKNYDKEDNVITKGKMNKKITMSLSVNEKIPLIGLFNYSIREEKPRKKFDKNLSFSTKRRSFIKHHSSTGINLQH
jgi:hypothetical protein